MFGAKVKAKLIIQIAFKRILTFPMIIAQRRGSEYPR